MIKVYNAIDFTLVYSFQAHANTVNQIKQLPNGLVATTSQDATIKLWNPSTSCVSWTLIQTYTGHSIDVISVEYIDAYTIASVSINDGTIQIWSIYTGQTNRTINTGTNPFSLALLSNGFYLACGLNSHLRIYNIYTGNLVSSFIESSFNGYAITDLALINGEILASAGTDHFVCLWNLSTNTLKYNLTGHTGEVIKLKLVKFEILASASLDNTIILWNITSGTLLRSLACHTNQIWFAIDLINDERDLLVSGSLDQTLKVWNFNTGLLLNSINTGMSIKSLAVVNSSLAKSKF